MILGVRSLSPARRRLVAARRTVCNLRSQAARRAGAQRLASPAMSSHRSRRAAAVDPRAAGRRRIVGATTVSAVGRHRARRLLRVPVRPGLRRRVGPEARARPGRAGRPRTSPPPSTPPHPSPPPPLPSPPQVNRSGPPAGHDPHEQPCPDRRHRAGDDGPARRDRTRRRSTRPSGVLHAELAAIDAACSRFRPDSEISRLHAAAGAATPVGPLLAEALTRRAAGRRADRRHRRPDRRARRARARLRPRLRRASTPTAPTRSRRRRPRPAGGASAGTAPPSCSPAA